MKFGQWQYHPIGRNVYSFCMILESIKFFITSHCSCILLFQSSNYTVFRKNRIEVGGGVFWCVRETLNVTEQPELNLNAEIVWAKITLAKRNPICICSFYRPPDPSTEPILQLQTSLNIKQLNFQILYFQVILIFLAFAGMIAMVSLPRILVWY